MFGRKFLQDDFDRMDKISTVYLYCSNKVMLNIFENGELWLTDSSFMNDPKELNFYDEIIYSTIEKMKNHDISSDEGEMLKAIYNDCVIDHRSFFSCFSCAGDSLPLWDRYGDESKGVSIGFNLMKLEVRKEPTVYHWPIMSEKKQLGVLPVHYWEEEDNNEIYEILKELVESARNDIKEDELEGLTLENVYQYKILPLCGLRDMVKSSSFKDEREVRIVYNEWEETKMFNTKIKRTKSNLFGCCYRSGDDNVQRYYKLKINIDDCIQQIILGPNNNTKIEDS